MADFVDDRRVVGAGHHVVVAEAAGRRFVVCTECGAYSHKRWGKLNLRCRPTPNGAAASRVRRGLHPA
eukprot:4962092-Amphidinium_carterae.1